MKLKGKVAVVTGAAGGLGRGIALSFAREGARIVACDINEAALAPVKAEIQELGAECLSLRCDVSDSADVDAMFARIDAYFGTTHILVNNAALVPEKPHDEERRKRHYGLATRPIPRQSLGITKDMSDTEWHRFWSVNVDGVFFCTRAALQRMEAQRYGRIINIGSVAGISAASAHSPHYSAAKGAVVAFTRSVGYEVCGANVLVNCICPGGVQTPAFERYIDQLSPEERNTMWQLVPLGRLGKPEEYGALAVYLASEECYLVGSIINASGGAVV
ncbi:SDR family NAD(P)-dependent oxidoreductase [Noviherbaspirillum sedimenti]|uniref:SDR family oxidoreductase n=1 Tax=Noviherbaspirillum sedimenti TaxID=2320865 RepID=A0A3A3G4Y6_9BURK|nr:SDR family NAD(P)-dependent oxidoreductase [Noviherbaspirillum sedimenti]RJG03001.1 SDR family oxidoreductase [Noviherbaspirillum sedimenti]